MLESREAAILETLQELPKRFVLIGGYAVNAYVPPRFSIDCDLFIFGDVAAIKKILVQKGFEQTEKGDVHYGKYLRFVRKSDKVSFDLLIDSVLDRESGIAFEGSLFEQYSQERFTAGRANPVRIKLRIADPELLFVMKFVCSRRQDIRDIFMLSGTELKWDLIKKIIVKKCNPKHIEESIQCIEETVRAKSYRNSLHGAFGKIPDKTFERCLLNLTRFLDRLKS